jgi:hypothetical protein
MLMRRPTALLPAMLALCVVPTLVRAGEAPTPLVCSIVEVFDCSAAECVAVESETVGVPDLMRLDPGKKTVTALDTEFSGTTSTLEAMTVEGGTTSARAHEGDRSLAISIDGKTGDAILAVSDNKLVLVAYGECARP